MEIFVFPAVRCNWCDRRTHIAQLSGDHLSHFEGVCYEHGFVDFLGDTPSKQERRAVFASVERFVLGWYDNVGSATVISPAQLGEIPGYVPTQLNLRNSRGELLSPESSARMRGTDRAFYCRYTDSEGKTRYCWPIWDMALLSFRLIEKDEPLEQASLQSEEEESEDKA
jgi:hypothetical protein